MPRSSNVGGTTHLPDLSTSRARGHRRRLDSITPTAGACQIVVIVALYTGASASSSDVLFSFFSGSSCRLELRLGSCKGPTWNARRDQQLTVEGPRQLSGHQGPSRSEKEPSPTLIACCIGSSSPLFLAAMSDPAASSAGPSHKAHHASRSGKKAEKKDKAKGIDRSGGKGFNEKASPFHL